MKRRNEMENFCSSPCVSGNTPKPLKLQYGKCFFPPRELFLSGKGTIPSLLRMFCRRFTNCFSELQNCLIELYLFLSVYKCVYNFGYQSTTSRTGRTNYFPKTFTVYKNHSSATHLYS